MQSHICSWRQYNEAHDQKLRGELMSKLAHKDKPWLGPITWEPLSNLPDLIRTVDNAVMNTQEHASMIAQAVDNAHLFADFPVSTIMVLTAF